MLAGSHGTALALFAGGLLDASIVLAEEQDADSSRFETCHPKVVQSLKALARRHNRSMEQEVRELIEGYVAERRAVLDQIEAGWHKQARRPTAAESTPGWESGVREGRR